MDTLWTREKLVAAIEGGSTFKFMHFWGHTAESPDRIDASCLSQWFPRAFEEEGVHYPSAEHFMMAAKARRFGDQDSLNQILLAASPAEAKALGREVRGFDEEAWAEARSQAVVAGNLAKFGQHPDLRAFLLATGETVLVEASPRDLVWGIGMGASNPAASDPRAWRGLNLLGFALMEARRVLRGAPGLGSGTHAP